MTTLIHPQTRADTLSAPELETVPGLFYRRNEFCRDYRPVLDRTYAEWLLGSTTFNSPWVTIVRGAPAGDHTYFQVLGAPDRLIAEGGGQIGSLRWNWRATALPKDFTFTTVGPGWYEIGVYRGDLVTVDDARRIMWDALANDIPALRTHAGMEALYFA